MSPFVILILALIIDHFLGEPKNYHPLVGFGRYAAQIEKLLNSNRNTAQKNQIMGLISVFLAVLPFYLLSQFLAIQNDNLIISIFEAVILYFTIGLQSLKKHALEIYLSLLHQDIDDSQLKVAMIVSRDTDKMQAEDISRASIESILENGNDAVFAPIFWFIVAGVPAVICYRLINTLDAMWGYKIPRYKEFGYSAAKLDDLLNYIPARLTALSYALMGNWLAAKQCWKTQAQHWPGMNPGVVMAAGSGALGIKLGGGDYYHGEYISRPLLGLGKKAETEDIITAVKLINRATCLWLCLLLLIYYPDIFNLI